jgi:hypothetical protein
VFERRISECQFGKCSELAEKGERYCAECADVQSGCETDQKRHDLWMNDYKTCTDTLALREFFAQLRRLTSFESFAGKVQEYAPQLSMEQLKKAHSHLMSERFEAYLVSIGITQKTKGK